ncbi:MAG: SDR family oxidoreductase [Chloroflexi bacterium]|nr:SDR family oxidoreductase [Chloroflexota bacterium]
MDGSTTGRLSGKVALVTGGAQGRRGRKHGFGGATSWAFCAEGARVVIGDIDEENGRATVSDLVGAGFEAQFVHLDVTSREDWERAVNLTAQRYGRVDILASIAGYGDKFDVMEVDDRSFDLNFDRNPRAMFYGIQSVVPEMRRAGGGSIIQMASINGLVGSTSSAAYHAAKGAVRLIVKAAAIQLAPDKIRVNGVFPGYADTVSTNDMWLDPEMREPRLARVPMGELIMAEDVAPAFVYLASDEARWVTGSELVIDGGMTAQ